MANVAFYNIQYIPGYARQFAYLGPHIRDRYRLLHDEDGVVKNNRHQSDVVSIFLNLSAIPDEVIQGLEISEAGLNFNESMDRYLKKYPFKSFGKSTNAQWIQLYMDFLEGIEKGAPPSEDQAE